MTESDILKKLQNANLVGRGGSGFPVYLKWMAVRKAEAPKKYVIMNASEHEPNVRKDHELLTKHTEIVFKGMRIAMDYLETKECVINLNKEYGKELKSILTPVIEKLKEDDYHIHLYKNCTSYIGGEETALMEAIEGRRVQPRLKPPYPTQVGLYGMPSLVHNVETFYDIALVAKDKFEKKRFYTISGAVPNEGVFHLPIEWTIEQMLKETNNLPDEEFFVQAGGGASGVVLNHAQVKVEQAEGAGAIIVHKADEDPRELFLTWLEFYDKESCGKCSPCREGTYQLHKMVEESEEIPWEDMEPILETLEETSFCPLGKSVPIAIKSYKTNILDQNKLTS